MSGDQNQSGRDKTALLRRAIEVCGNRVIEVSFSDGKTYHIPVPVLAMERAIYFAEGDEARGDGTFDETYETELTVAVDDPSYFLDWVANSNNWEDVSDYAVFYSEEVAAADYASEWNGADLEVLQYDEGQDKWVRSKSRW